MANAEKNSITISKNNSDFPSYLDFEKLRSESIGYLGKLSGKLWTDHNVHDPGITILEVLCYALLDLGYRTNLPVEDILAYNHPADTDTDTNFFTAAKILSCNPLTIIDYRKLLIDIPGVKNAWLIPATDITDLCRNQQYQNSSSNTAPEGSVTSIAPNKETQIPYQNECVEFLNGIYHIYIETEKDPDKDFETSAESEKYISELTGLVRKTLLAHRNICEDFEDIFILCKVETGVCASIELDEDADTENVYLDIAEQLSNFFSPAPQFYTLPQLLEKGKAIEDIFAGRPYSKESHGFVDTEEFEKIKLRKEIHTSDIYNCLFEVNGVKKISRLRLKTCEKGCDDAKNPEKNYWKSALPKNHIPYYSPSCSGFEFTKKGIPVNIDSDKIKSLLEINLSQRGKVKMSATYPYLDNRIPSGIYRNDLEDYFSIQNDFPRVYGIGEGGLPENVSPNRKAQALQLKAYLLFFDQLLANYASQLKNIRQLFSLQGMADKKKQHSYFLNTLNTVPEMNRLFRFGTDEKGGNAITQNGDVVVFPVLKKDWEKIDTTLLFAENIIQSQTPYSFSSLNTLHENTDLLREELLNEDDIIVKTWKTADQSWLYTIHHASAEFIMLGKKISCTEAEALQLAASAKYTGIFEKNYNAFITKTDQFTFTITSNLVTYTDYLGTLVENEDLYLKRRKHFLSHLLSRFAEKFTDFALLQWKSGYENKDVEVVERFLTNYDEVSRNRGRAYDYLTGGWNNDNISGFEKKLSLLAGINNSAKDYLCNFVVDLYDEQYRLDFSAAGEAAFIVNEKFDLRKNALEAAGKLIKAIATPECYQLQYLAESKKYQLLLHYGAAQPAIYPVGFTSKAEAESLTSYISRNFANKLTADEIVENSWIWTGGVYDEDGTLIKSSVEKWHTEEAVLKAPSVLAAAINDPAAWQYETGKPVISELIVNNNSTDEISCIDINAFNIDLNDTIIDKPGLYTYDVLDKGVHSFKLSALKVFESREEANKHCCQMLFLANDAKNYLITHVKSSGRYRITIHSNQVDEAAVSGQYETFTDAENAIINICRVIHKHTYTLRMNKKPETWKFRYRLGRVENSYWFYSKNSYKENDIKENAASFHSNITELIIKETKDEIVISDPKNKKVPIVSIALPSDPLKIDTIKKEFSYQQAMGKMSNIRSQEDLDAYITVDDVGEEGTFVYKLVNKNNLPAFYTEEFADESTAWEQRKVVAANSKKALQSVLQICLGGDIFTEIKDNKNTERFRYQIRLRNFHGIQGNELVLFESVAGYLSKEEAEKKFTENYLQILNDASLAEQYGKTISIKPLPLPSTEECSVNEAIVFIPEETLLILKRDWGWDTWKEKLIPYIKTYPIKIIDANSEAFALMFCKEYKKPPEDCRGNEKKWVYYFTMYPRSEDMSIVNQPYWQSKKYYEDIKTTTIDFLHFCKLLKYTGNYFVDCSCTKIKNGSTGNPEYSTRYAFKIFIREVLAQSINWYESYDEAWGREGIEKFICAVQSEKSFKKYYKPAEKCYSFLVSCGNGAVEHPCKYDTEKQRDIALEKLYKKGVAFAKNDPYSNILNGKSDVLTNKSGITFAKVIQNNTKYSGCDFFIQLSHQLQSGNYTIYYKDEWLLCSINKDEIVLQSFESKKINDSEELEEWKNNWKEMLKEWAYHFPIVINTSGNINTQGNKSLSTQYCLEIKLPEFSGVEDDLKPNEPCNCNNASPNEDPVCFIAWKGNCPYSTAQEAAMAYKKVIELLHTQKNYYAAFDCACNSFGITLNSNHPVLVKNENSIVTQSDIIAFNPQCYQTTDEVCEAVDMATKLVNSEGLHLVEHILLRPHCKEDCNCKERKRDCVSSCEFPPYKPADTDPCENGLEKICFIPGADPYSFIATVALPAWPARFRDPNNRMLIENLIYKEAPAHVLLRILWLKPGDFYQFETAIKKWNQWLTGKKTCNQDFDQCNFLHLLFKYYDCIDECIDCQPCSAPPLSTIKNCADDNQATKKYAFQFLNQVNDVFCLPGFCNQHKEDATLVTEIQKLKIKSTIAEPIIPDQKNQPESKKKDIPPAVSEKNETKKIDTRNKIDAIKNNRRSKYIAIADHVLTNSNGNELAAKLNSFIMGNEPDAEGLNKFNLEVIKNKKPSKKGAKFLNSHQQLDLIKAAVCHFLDKNPMRKKEKSSISIFQNMADILTNGGIDVQQIYNYWDAAEIERYDAETDTNLIKMILAGKKKK